MLGPPLSCLDFVHMDLVLSRYDLGSLPEFYSLSTKLDEDQLNLHINFSRSSGSEKLDISVAHSPLPHKGTLKFDQKILGVLGILRIEHDDFMFVISDAISLGTLDGHEIFQIKKVDCFCLSTNKWDFSRKTISPDEFNVEMDKIQSGDDVESAVFSLIKYLSQGTFYFCPTRSLSTRLQSLAVEGTAEDAIHFEWNHFLLNPINYFLKLQDDVTRDLCAKFSCFPIIVNGFIGKCEKRTSEEDIDIWLISRVGSIRCGTRYFLRGLDDDGHVANFVETETIVATNELIFSYVILRGSVPAFWDQQGIQVPYNKIQLTRSPIATQPAFERHVSKLEKSYGIVHMIDLLSRTREQSEQFLSSALEYHVRKASVTDDCLNITHFDLNQEFLTTGSYIEKLEDLFKLVSHEVPIFSYFVKSLKNSKIVRRQKGSFRVNCFDCLDRTNIAQWFISCRVVDLFLRNYSIAPFDDILDSIRSLLNDLWADNGDQISMIYTGSGALKSSITRSGQYSIQGFMKDVKRSAKRLYSSQFIDDAKNDSIRLLLGADNSLSLVKLHDIFEISQDVDKKDDELSNRVENLKIQCITWNVNGLIPGIQNIDDLFLNSQDFIPDIIAIAFQEIVELNPTQIISVDPERKLQWERTITSALRDIYGESFFSLLVSNQLVGTTLSIFVKNDIVRDIRNVEIGKKMTGLGGIAGNKGSVAVWLSMQSSTFCFVSSHFSAGQNNILDRNSDWRSVYYDLESNTGHLISSRQMVFWMGDLNYRLDCSRETVLKNITSKDFPQLYQFDQLLGQKKLGNIFAGFTEAPINFEPTYKYDPGSNIYDTSEKARVPSWTDRILVKGDKVEILSYERREIDFSDHKPVMLLASANLGQNAEFSNH